MKHFRIVVALPRRPNALLSRDDCVVHLLDADLVHRRIDVTSVASTTTMIDSSGGRSRHHVRNDHVAVRHSAWNHWITIRPAGEERTAGQGRAGAIHAPGFRERTRLPEDAA